MREKEGLSCAKILVAMSNAWSLEKEEIIINKRLMITRNIAW